jgi:hypothetical protein
MIVRSRFNGNLYKAEQAESNGQLQCDPARVLPYVKGQWILEAVFGPRFPITDEQFVRDYEIVE